MVGCWLLALILVLSSDQFLADTLYREGGTRIYKCGEQRVYPSNNLLTPHGSPQPFAMCCNKIPFDDRAQSCCSSGLQSKKRGSIDCCESSTKGVCDTELDCWGSLADCALQSAAMLGGPATAAGYSAASAISSFVTDKNIGQWLIDSFLDGEDDFDSSKRDAAAKFTTFAQGNGQKANSSASLKWKQRFENGATKMSTLLDLAQAIYKIGASEKIGDAVETGIKSFVNLLDAERSSIKKWAASASTSVAKAIDSSPGQTLRNIVRRIPAACLASAAYDCGKAYGPAAVGRQKRSQIYHDIKRLKAQRDAAFLLATINNAQIEILWEILLDQELTRGPFLTFSTLMALDETADHPDGETIAEFLYNETDRFYAALKRAVEPSSERGARLSYLERQELQTASANKDLAPRIVSFLSRAFDQHASGVSITGIGVIASVDRRLRKLNRQVGNETLENMKRFYDLMKNVAVDSEYSIVYSKSDGSRVFAVRPVSAANNPNAMFTTYLPLSSGYVIQNAVRIGRKSATTAPVFVSFPDGIGFHDNFDDSEAIYFFKVIN